MGMRKRIKSKLHHVVRLGGLCVLLLFAGCEERDVASGLDQVEANKIVAELHREGINAIASGETGGRGKFTVTVDEVLYQKAVAILDAKGLPDRDAAALRSLMTPSGLLPASRQIEAMRLDYTLSLQLATLLRSNSGVRDAKVVARLNSLAPEEKPSISIALTEETPNALPDAEVEKLVRQIFTGIEPGQYAITRSKASSVDSPLKGIIYTTFGVRIFEEEYSRFVTLILGALFVFGLFGAVIGYFGGYRRAMRAEEQRADLPALWKGQQDIDLLSDRRNDT